MLVPQIQNKCHITCQRRKIATEKILKPGHKVTRNFIHSMNIHMALLPYVRVFRMLGTKVDKSGQNKVDKIKSLFARSLLLVWGWVGRK